MEWGGTEVEGRGGWTRVIAIGARCYRSGASPPTPRSRHDQEPTTGCGVILLQRCTRAGSTGTAQYEYCIRGGPCRCFASHERAVRARTGSRACASPSAVKLLKWS